MIIDILILSAISVVLYFIIPFICDLISLPFNMFSFRRLKDENDFGIHFKPKWYDLFLAFLAFCVFTYLFAGICVSYFSWMKERHPDSFFAKSIAVAIGAAVSSSFSRKAGKMILENASMAYLPSVLGATYVKTATYIICVLLLVFPKLIQYWPWMPYVK